MKRFTRLALVLLLITAVAATVGEHIKSGGGISAIPGLI
jgi:hypothetical protein